MYSKRASVIFLIYKINTKMREAKFVFSRYSFLVTSNMLNNVLYKFPAASLAARQKKHLKGKELGEN